MFKCLGTELPPPLAAINDTLFHLIYRISEGHVSGIGIARELADLLERKDVIDALSECSDFYVPKGQD